MSRIDANYGRFRAAHPLRYCTVGRTRWEYIDCGAGSAMVVLLPGALGVADTAFQYCLTLAPRYRVLSLGYPDSLTTVADLADGVAGLLAMLGVEQAHVVGGSYSGMVAQALVRRHPTCVRTLILTHAGVPRPARVPLVAALLLLLKALPLPLLRALFAVGTIGFLPTASPAHRFWRAYFATLVARLPRAFYRARACTALDFDLRWRLTQIDITQWDGGVLIVEADNDGFFGASERRALRQLYPLAELHCLRGGHNSALDQTEATVTILAKFLHQHMHR